MRAALAPIAATMSDAARSFTTVAVDRRHLTGRTHWLPVDGTTRTRLPATRASRTPWARDAAGAPLPVAAQGPPSIIASA